MKKSKVVLALACAVLLAGASIMGTLAYLTSTPDAVKNTFTVGAGVTITLDEADVDELGNQVYKTGDTTPADRVKENSYKLMPGHEYKKDPTVHVKGEECYVFVTVTNGISGIEADTNKIADQITSNNWKAVDGYENLYVYAEGIDTKTAVKATSETVAKDLVVFSKFTVKEDADQTAIAAVKDYEIVINAYAVQTVDFTDNTPAEIWAEVFEEEEPTEVPDEPVEAPVDPAE